MLYKYYSYDSHGVFSSPRALFMFRAFGHERSSILNGGLPNWRAHGGPLETGHLKPAQEARYRVPKLNNFVIRSACVRVIPLGVKL